MDCNGLDMDVEGNDERKEHPPFFKSVRNYFREYCNYSSIHGFRYFGEKRTYFERGWWFMVFSITLAGCLYAIWLVYLKWVGSPVIVSFATRETPIYSIPFPAVTICPQAKTNQEAFNHTDILRKQLLEQPLTSREQKLFDYMGLICEEATILKSSRSQVYTDDFYEELKNISTSSPFFACSYMGEKCEFKTIITDEGICYTFNMLDRSDIYNDKVVQFHGFHDMNASTYNWSMDDGYSEDAGIDAYPRRALLAGTKNALSIKLITRKFDMDSTCKGSIQGFRVLLHIPSRIPRPSQQYFMVPQNQQVLAAIQPVMMTTSESVRQYNPRHRECYFPFERSLKYFKIYTSLNCKLECLTDYTLKNCGCVNYYMPRENTTSICGIGKLWCMNEAESRLQMLDLHSKIDLPKNKSDSDNTTETFLGEDLPDCDCMPICSDLSYNTEISQNDWTWLDLFKAYSKNGSLPFEKDDYHLSHLVLYFKSAQFITSQRHELYGPTDFLANFGGLLGLFTGFSILSLMEAIYFLTIRICCNSRLYGYWAGPET